MNTETVAPDTEVLDPAPAEVVYAWGYGSDDTGEVSRARGVGRLTNPVIMCW